MADMTSIDDVNLNPLPGYQNASPLPSGTLAGTDSIKPPSVTPQIKQSTPENAEYAPPGAFSAVGKDDGKPPHPAEMTIMVILTALMPLCGFLFGLVGITRKGRVGHGAALIILSLVLALAYCGIAFLPPKPVHWEYVTKDIPDDQLDDQMSQLGHDGWELVFARRATSDGGGEYEFIFKRPAQGNNAQ